MSAVRERVARPSSDTLEESSAPQRRGRARRVIGWTLIGLMAYLFVEAMIVSPSRQPSATVAVGVIRAYQSVLSPHVGKVVTCKFRPTCSHYGAGAIEKHGTVVGTAKTCGRLWRCSPWGPPAGEDLP